MDDHKIRSDNNRDNNKAHNPKDNKIAHADR